MAENDLSDRIGRGLETFISTDSPALGALDAIFGDDPDNLNDINRDTDVNKLGVAIGMDEQTKNISGLETQDTTSLSGSTALTESQRQEVARQIAEGTQSTIGTQTDTGQQTSVGTQADTGRQISTGTQADTGRQISTGTQADTGLQTTTGRDISLGEQTAAGQQTSAGQQVSAGTTTGEASIGAFTGATDFGTSGYDPATGQFTSNVGGAFSGNVDASLNASNQAFNALSGGFDNTLAQRYNALEQLQEQDRLQANLDLEDRLYSQGRLGSSGGSLQQNALLDAIAQQQSQNQVTAFNQALAQRGQFGQEATAFSANALAPQQLSLQQLQTMGNLAPQLSQDTVNQNITTQDVSSNLLDTTSRMDINRLSDVATSNLSKTAFDTATSNLSETASDVATSNLSQTAFDTTNRNVSENIQDVTNRNVIDNVSNISDVGFQDTTAFTDTSSIGTLDQTQNISQQNIDIERQRANEQIRTV